MYKVLKKDCKYGKGGDFVPSHVFKAASWWSQLWLFRNPTTAEMTGYIKGKYRAAMRLIWETSD